MVESWIIYFYTHTQSRSLPYIHAPNLSPHARITYFTHRGLVTRIRYSLAAFMLPTFHPLPPCTLSLHTLSFPCANLGFKLSHYCSVRSLFFFYFALARAAFIVNYHTPTYIYQISGRNLKEDGGDIVSRCGSSPDYIGLVI